MNAKYLIDITWSDKSGWDRKQLAKEVWATLNAHLFWSPAGRYKIVVRNGETLKAKGKL